MEYLTVMLGRVSPLGVEVDAVVVRIPSHVIPVRKGCHRQWRRHRHARSLVSDTEYLLHRLLALYVLNEQRSQNVRTQLWDSIHWPK